MAFIFFSKHFCVWSRLAKISSYLTFKKLVIKKASVDADAFYVKDQKEH